MLKSIAHQTSNIKHHSAATDRSGSFHTKIGLRAASVSSSRRRGAWCGAVLSEGSLAFALATTDRIAPMN
jgi:hypothetical protein